MSNQNISTIQLSGSCEGNGMMLKTFIHQYNSSLSTYEVTMNGYRLIIVVNNNKTNKIQILKTLNGSCTVREVTLIEVHNNIDQLTLNKLDSPDLINSIIINDAVNFIRSMNFNFETGNLHIFKNDHEKLKSWDSSYSGKN